MGRITNAPKWNNPILRAVRGTLEHRAAWLYLLLKEAQTRGIAWEEVGRPAIRACGTMHGRKLVHDGGTRSLRGLKKTLFTLPARWVFEMRILEATDHRLAIDFGHCPLVAAWQKLGCTDEEIARLCDIAMEGDRGIAQTFGAELVLEGTIAAGDDRCRIRFSK